jgi:hypothetical protein
MQYPGLKNGSGVGLAWGCRRGCVRFTGVGL